MNIFTDEYANQEAEFMRVVDMEFDNARVFNRSFAGGRLNDYLAVNYRADPLPCIPTYTLDGVTWMSITPMEVQSLWVPIMRGRRHKHVALGGLGMGYAALRIAESPKVSQIDVYELDSRAIELFTQHKDKFGFEKIRVIQGDCRDPWLVDKIREGYDYVMMDIYESLLPDEVFEDIGLFAGGDHEYRFWGQELVYYLAAFMEDFPLDELVDANLFTNEDWNLIQMFQATDGASMAPPTMDTKFAMACVEKLLEVSQ